MLRMYVPVLACAALLAAGCGGDDSGGSPNSLTKDEYAAQANKVCSDTAEMQEDYEERIDSLERGDLEAAAPIIAEVLEKTRVGYDRLKALSPPAADQADVDAYLSSVQRLLASRDEITEAARDNDAAAGERASDEGDEIDIEQERLADKLALDDCKNIF